MTVRNAEQLVTLIENTLGWAPELTPKKPMWKHRSIMAGRFKRKMATNPNLYTWRNLELAVELLRRKGAVIDSPFAVFAVVKDAVKAANPEPVSNPLADEIDEAIGWEWERKLPDWERWTALLARAVGPYRQNALDDWRAARL